MDIEHHDLHREFPQYNEKIHELKISNTHFSRLYGEYNDLDQQIRRAEQRVENISDFDLEQLKLKRVHLKDQLFHILQGS